MTRRAILILILQFSLLKTLHAELVTYPWPETAPKSEYYSVRISQGETEHDAFVHFTKPNLNRIPAGVKSSFDDNDGVTGLFEDRTFSFVQFSFTGTIELEVTKLYGDPAKRIEVSPKAYGIHPDSFDGRTVKFQVTNLAERIEYLSINFISPDNQDDGGNGTTHVKHGMVLFGDKPETDIPDSNAPGTVLYSDSVSKEALAAADLIYFPPGDYDIAKRYPLFDPIPGQDVDLNPHGAQVRYSKDGQAIYAAGGAYIRGSVWAQGHDNLKLYGRGIFTGDDLWWHAIRREGDLCKEAFMNFLGSSNTTIEGIVVVNPTHHTIPSSNNTTIRNLKIIGFASNMDGVRPSSGSLVEEVFIRTSDDYDYARDPHTMRNSVLWMPRNGAIGQLGWNNLGTGYTQYDQLYIIHAEAHGDTNKRNVGVIGSVLQQGVNQSNNIIENVYGEDGFGVLVHLTIERDANDTWDPQNPGEIKDFTFKNILLETDFRLNNGERFRNPIKGFEYDGAKAMIRDVRFINLIAGNTLVTQENHDQFFDIDPNTTENIAFTTEGPLHNISSSSNSGGTMYPPAGDIPTPKGMDRYINIVPDLGYKIEDVIVDGYSQGRLQTVFFPDVSQDHTVEVTFSPASDDYFQSSPTPEVIESKILWVPDQSERILDIDLTTAPQLVYEVKVSKDLSFWSSATIQVDGAEHENPFSTGFRKELEISVLEEPPFFARIVQKAETTR
ncbi:hypothetical protein QEH56_07520 [Pelagicoccus enzymogenes]|uniref:hypothetical protein n=1 Tax=Pelagicoccus enzymogenes TaxID=2773457 RepID=UPI00280D9CD3|nr:hypothetical protein [Pelagicoccus enzymogenes]MDQ8197991.1 hypothetical protein [Pelagicoccus enzymogenes]